MFNSQHFSIFLLFLTCVDVRCDYYSRYYERRAFHNLCNTETGNALEEIKSAVQDLHNLVVGVRQKIDPDFKFSPPNTSNCPSGFTYLPLAKSCYKVVFESHNWTSAAQKCQDIRSGSHLVAITSATENIVLKKFLEAELSKNVGNTACIPSDLPGIGNAFWTCGQRLIENSCASPFVWKPSSDEKVSLEFASWVPGQPDCYEDEEFCLHLFTKDNFGWNDQFCTRKMCPLCEYKP